MPLCLNEVLVKKLGYALLKPMTILATELWWTALKNSQFTWISLATDPTLAKYEPLTAKAFWKTATVSCEYRDDCTTRFWCTLMVAVKQVYTVFWETVGKIWEPFVLSNHSDKHWAPRQHYTHAAALESISLRWLVSGARGPIRRNRSNRFKTGHAHMFTLC